MTVYQKTYERDEFIHFLEKIHVGDTVINKFKELPETFVKNGTEFNLYISSIWHSKGKTYYEFELNYYSEKLIEYLFGSKVFTDVEFSINYLLCEIKNANCPHKK
jgi:hypothetical protein